MRHPTTRAHAVCGLAAIACALLACRDLEPIERLPAPDKLPPLDPFRSPPPPPLPPPPRPMPVPCPAPIADVLRRAGPVSATLHKLAEHHGGTRFLGYRETTKRNLAAAVADELAARLLRDTSCVHGGDYGGIGQPIGLSLTRGGATVHLVEDRGHLFLTPEGHAGDLALFAPDMATFVEKLAE